MQRFLIFFILSGLFFASCVPNRKIVYLQKDNELKEHVVLDSVQREYKLADYEYRIQPEDILSIKFESLTQNEYDVFSNLNSQSGVTTNVNNLLIGGYLVNKEGFIALPVIGEIKVEGLTVHEIQKSLEKVAELYVEKPLVKVRLLNFRITVLGEVNTEGIVSSLNNRISILEVIGQAGGLTDLADRSKIKIIRQSNGQSQIYYIDLLDENIMSSSSFFAYQNDIIIVPPLRQRPFRKYFGQNVGLFLSSISTLLLVINLLNK